MIYTTALIVRMILRQTDSKKTDGQNNLKICRMMLHNNKMFYPYRVFHSHVKFNFIEINYIEEFYCNGQ